MTAVSIQLQLADSSDKDAHETHFGWPDAEVMVKFPDAPIEVAAGPADPSGLIRSLDNNQTVTITAAHKKGPHTWPIVYPIDPLPLAPDAKGTLTLRERRRISAWASPLRLVKMNSSGQAEMTAKKTWGDAHDDGTARHYYQLADFFSTGLPGLDDISVVSTIFFTPDLKGVDWARDFLQETDPAKDLATHRDVGFVRDRFLRQLIAECHRHGIQVFAGFYVDSGNGNAVSRDHAQRMLDYFRKEADPGPVARAINLFFDSRGLEIDGVWFDFEVDTLRDTDRPRVEAFVRAVADELGKVGRYVAFASAPDSKGAMQPHFFSHPADLGKYPNVLVRPMTYDTRTVGNTVCDSSKNADGSFVTPIQSMGRETITRRHLGHYGLHPAQLQIAMGHCSNESAPEIRSKLIALGTELRPFRVGIIHWNLQNAADAASYAQLDTNLNGPNQIPRGTFGQPIQGPLNRKRVQVLKDAGASVTVPPADVVDR